MSAPDLVFVRSEEEPEQAPPRRTSGAVAWLRANLFSSVANTILTLVGLALIAFAVPPSDGDGAPGAVRPGRMELKPDDDAAVSTPAEEQKPPTPRPGQRTRRYRRAL